jgi:hypothetical protein
LDGVHRRRELDFVLCRFGVVGAACPSKAPTIAKPDANFERDAALITAIRNLVDREKASLLRGSPGCPTWIVLGLRKLSSEHIFLAQEYYS